MGAAPSVINWDVEPSLVSYPLVKPMARPKNSPNPFSYSFFVAGYEAWFITICERTDCLEEKLLKWLFEPIAGASSI